MADDIDICGGTGNDELAERIVGLYQRHSVAWTTARGARLIEGAWLDRFCDVVPEGTDLLDMGCGSGMPIAHDLVGRGYRVTGVDSAPEMVALFEKNVPGQPAFVADMRDLSLGCRFAGILAWDSFFHLSPHHQRRMFAIFRAHAAPGAALMFTSGPDEGSAIGELEGEPLYHASLSQAEYRALLGAHGFQVMRHVVEDPECGRRTVWLAQLASETMPAETSREQ